MAKFMFKGNVHHDKKKFVKGDACPDELAAHMLKLGVVDAVVEPAKPKEEPKK